MQFHVLTLNIHKGVCIRNRRYVLPQIREELIKVSPDIVFLQEVQGSHTRRARHIKDWVDTSQEQYLAHNHWPYTVYGQNASYEEGHHGNSILSRYPIESWENFDVSTSSFERRGILYAVIRRTPGEKPLHCFCVHFDLRRAGRLLQFAELAKRVQLHVPPGEPVIIGGDFNDPTYRSDSFLRPLGLTDAVVATKGKVARTFPAPLPLLSLDRIYSSPDLMPMAQALNNESWKRLSDHVPVHAVIHAHSVTRQASLEPKRRRKTKIALWGRVRATG